MLSGDLKLALVHCEGMRKLVAENPARWPDDEALPLVRGLCERAREVIADPVCRGYLSVIDDYAAALLATTADVWSPGRLHGPKLVQREILRELHLLADRLANLQRGRAVASGDPKVGEAHRRERYSNVLRHAAETVGGTARLAPLLGVPLQSLQLWMEGGEMAPLDAFLNSLDLVAGGPFSREPPRVRVAVVPTRQVVVPPRAKPTRGAAMLQLLFGLALGFCAALTITTILSEGSMIGFRTAAQVAASLCALAVVLAWVAQSRLGPLAAAASVVVTASATLYLAYCAWQQLPTAHPPLAASHAAPRAEAAPKAIERAPAARPARRHAAVQPKVIVASLDSGLGDACAYLTGAASLQCMRCAAESGLSWLLCQESTRLEYCNGREGAECPSAIPTSPPN